MSNEVILRIKEIGEVKAEFVKTTTEHIHLSSAILNNASSTIISSMKINKKHIVSFKRLGTPNFESFTDAQLNAIISLGNKTYEDLALKEKKIRRLKIEAGEDFGVDNTKKNMTEQVSFTANKMNERKDSDSLKKFSSINEKKNSKKTQKLKSEWDQFETNETLFRIKSEFDINEYAEPIDRNAKNYGELYEKSLKIANEISKNSPEETKMADSFKDGLTDDALYSTVSKVNVWSDLDNKEIKKGTVQEMVKVFDVSQELKEQEETLKNIVGGDSENMWSNVASFLSKKKQVESAVNAVSPCSSPEIVAPMEKLTPNITERIKDDSEKKLSNSLDMKKNKTHNKNPSIEKDKDSRNMNINKNYNKDHEQKQFSKSNFSKKSETPDRKLTKSIVFGNMLKFEDAKDCISSIKSKFSSETQPNKLTSWGNGNSIDEKISLIKANNVFLLPSEQRILEIESHSRFIFRK